MTTGLAFRVEVKRLGRAATWARVCWCFTGAVGSFARTGAAESTETAARPAAAAPLPSPTTAQLQVEEATEVLVMGTRPPLRGPRTPLLAREAALSAGNQGDAAKVVSSLPGVASPGARGEPVVWGSAPRDTGIFLDQVPLPVLFHGSALRSMVPSGILSTLRLTPGGYGVELGRYLGGTFELTTTDEIPFDPRVTVSADALDAGVSAEVPLGQTSGAFLSARYGVVDRWLPQWLGAPANQLYSIPSYADASALFTFSLPNGDSVKSVWLTSHDAATRANDWASDSNQRHLHRGYAVYEHHTHTATVTTRTRLTPYVGLDIEAFSTKSVGTLSSERRRMFMGGLRVDTVHTWRSLQLEAGIDARYEQTKVVKAGSLTVPPREGDPHVFGLPPGRDFLIDQIDVGRVHVAPYAQADVQLDPLRINPGLRLETLVTDLTRGQPSSPAVPDTGATHFDLEWLPRIAVEWTWSRRSSWFAVLSRHMQAADAADLGTLTGNPNLQPARATHVVLGEVAQLTPTLSLQVSGFRKWLSHGSVRSGEEIAQPSRLLESSGEGDVWGTQVMLQLRNTSDWFGWLGVTLSSSRRSEPRFSSRPFDYDQPFVGTLVLNKLWGPWTFGTRLRLASGFPRPAVVGIYYDLQLERHNPVLSSVQWWRLPTLFALDLRAERRLSVGNNPLFVYAELLNATSHENVEDVAYNRDYSERQYLLGLPLLAFVGVRAEL